MSMSDSLMTVWVTVLFSMCVSSLILPGLEFPSHVELGQPVNMKCSFTKDPAQQIDTIKWYKDGLEFFRLLLLNNDDHIKQFPIAGVKIDYNTTSYHTQPQSGQHTVSLVNTTLSTSGVYRCQITEAQPPFHIEQQEKNLTIIIGGGMKPRFEEDMNNITVELGQDATFVCPVSELHGYYKVGWVKANSKTIQAIGTHVITHNSRVTVSHDDNKWMLHIAKAQLEDASPYLCQLNTDPMEFCMGVLNVIMKPDIVDITGARVVTEGGNVSSSFEMSHGKVQLKESCVQGQSDETENHSVCASTLQIDLLFACMFILITGIVNVL